MLRKTSIGAVPRLQGRSNLRRDCRIIRQAGHTSVKIKRLQCLVCTQSRSIRWNRSLKPEILSGILIEPHLEAAIMQVYCDCHARGISDTPCLQILVQTDKIEYILL